MCEICSEGDSQTHWLERRPRRRHLISLEGRRLPYDDYLAQRITERGLLSAHSYIPEGRVPNPKNQNELKKILNQPHPSNPQLISAGEYDWFKNGLFYAQIADKKTSNAFAQEDLLLSHLLDPEAAQLHYARRQRLHLKPFYPELSSPKPNLYYGELPNTIDERVRNALHEYIMPSNDILPAVPNLFLEVIPGSRELDMMRLAINNGATGARCIFNLQNYGNANPVYDGKAYTFTMIYCYDHLEIYTTYPLPSVQRSPPISPRVFHFSGSSVPLPHKCYYRSPLREDSNIAPTPPVAERIRYWSPVEPPIPTTQPTYDGNVYITTRLFSYQVLSDAEDLQKAITAFRNCCDWAEQQRKVFVKRANRVARGENPDL